MERTCQKCRGKIFFDIDDYSNIIRFDGKFYHYDCFVDLCNKRMNKSNASPKWGKALDSIEDINRETEKYLKGMISEPKDQLYRYILAAYNVTTISSFIFLRLQGLYDGSYIGTSRPIPPEDLLDMWKRRMENGYLEKIRAKNIVKGKKMTQDQIISYDLSVLVNSYDSYLRWKEKNKVLENNVVEANTEPVSNIDYSKLSIIAQNQAKKEEYDMNSLLDELFD